MSIGPKVLACTMSFSLLSIAVLCRLCRKLNHTGVARFVVMAGFAWSGGGVTVAVCGSSRNTQTDNDQSLNQGL